MNMIELLDEAPPHICKPGPSGTEEIFDRFQTTGDYAELFAHPSDAHVTYVLRGMPPAALVELCELFGIPLFEDRTNS